MIKKSKTNIQQHSYLNTNNIKNYSFKYSRLNFFFFKDILFSEKKLFGGRGFHDRLWSWFFVSKRNNNYLFYKKNSHLKILKFKKFFHIPLRRKASFIKRDWFFKVSISTHNLFKFIPRTFHIFLLNNQPDYLIKKYEKVVDTFDKENPQILLKKKTPLKSNLINLTKYISPVELFYKNKFTTLKIINKLEKTQVFVFYSFFYNYSNLILFNSVK